MTTLSTVEHWLTYHIRLALHKKFSIVALRRVAFIIALISCIAAGFVTLISLFTQPWQHRLGYSALQVNLVSSAVNLGGYLTPPLLGMLSDSHGPVVLSWLALLGFVPSYAYAAYVFDHGETHFAWTLVSFTAIGISTSAMFFCALLTCAKLYPKYKFLSISCPTTFYGISSLFGSQLLKNSWFWYGHKYLDLGRVFRCFTWFYVVIGISTWVSTSIVAMLKTTAEQEEHEPLLPGAAEIPAKSEYSKLLRRFLRDPSAYLVLILTFFTIGSLEMFLTNMGSVAGLVDPEDKTIQSQVLSYFALFSTIARAVVGLLADFFAARGISRMWIIYFLIVVGFFAQTLVTRSGSHPLRLMIASALSGATYGGLFTAIPTLTLTVWGGRVFGTAYGCFMVAPALGATIYGVFYAHVYDSTCSANVDSSCINMAFYATGTSFATALLVSIFVYYAIWKRKGIDI
ncbi:LAFE_0E07294g1_1 [Lachancea fermentati]|uniref:Probable transporter MCH1 n=1 Tax=Lachancea fermentati TaxID=4955 RepID=A0A1G4MD54_LACFM|nr:LAFE_0E07294g1_1 [Lachancea fermentati]